MSCKIRNKGKKVWLSVSYVEANVLYRFLRTSSGNEDLRNIRDKLKEAITEQKERLEGTNVSNRT